MESTSTIRLASTTGPDASRTDNGQTCSVCQVVDADVLGAKQATTWQFGPRGRKCSSNDAELWTVGKQKVNTEPSTTSQESISSNGATYITPGAKHTRLLPLNTLASRTSYTHGAKHIPTHNVPATATVLQVNSLARKTLLEKYHHKSFYYFLQYSSPIGQQRIFTAYCHSSGWIYSPYESVCLFIRTRVFLHEFSFSTSQVKS
jgi:hypothetical protein